MPLNTAELYQDLVARFLAELMIVTQEEPTPELKSGHIYKAASRLSSA
jgi:hypothetical protein